MKPALLIGSTLLLAATVLVAQSPAPSAQQSSIAVTVAPSGESCPVSMHALQGRGSGLIAVKNQAPPNGISQRIHLDSRRQENSKDRERQGGGSRIFR